jgi:hypothetical protein
MRLITLVISLVLILVPLVDAFETILQPRRVTHRFRFARLFYRYSWAIWRETALVLPMGKRREAFLGIFGPLSLLALFAAWVASLIVGFGLLHWSLRSPIQGGMNFLTYLYLSGCTFFTLAYGDLLPASGLTRTLGVLEAGLGFGFLAVIISYLPVLYQAFSRREATIALLDARAGSPPTALEFLLRLARCKKLDAADPFLAELERWAAELLESHLSFPVLSYYRSQHDNQSWLSTLTMTLDVCALLMTRLKHEDTYQAEVTFAVARHAAVDLGLILKAPPDNARPDRLTPELRQLIVQSLREAGVELDESPDADKKFDRMRGVYEPFVNGLAARFLFTLPPLAPDRMPVDNWQRSAWMARPPGIGHLHRLAASDDRDDAHF